MAQAKPRRRVAKAADVPQTAAVAGSSLSKRGWRRLFLGAYLALGLVHAYVTVARYDPVKQASDDSSHYLAMSRGLPLDQELKIYRWRALTPWVVSALPTLPAGLVGQYKVDAFKLERLRFAAWNTLGTVAAAWLLLLFMEALGFSVAQAGLGGLLFCTSFQVVTDGAAILVDPWANAALIGCLLAALRGRIWALGLAFGVGLFVKESVVLVAPLLYLLRPPRRWGLLAALLPGLAVYLWFRYGLYPGGQGLSFSAATVRDALAQFEAPRLWLYLAEEFLMNFLWLAPLAWLGWRDSAAFPGLRRMAWLLPALAVLPLAMGSEFARPWFCGFETFIPLAVLGLWRLAGLGSPPQQQRA